MQIDTTNINKAIEKLGILKAETFERNDKGYAKLFSTIYKDKHRYSATRRDWLVYDGIKWTDDREGLEARRSMKVLSSALNIYAAYSGDTDYAKSAAKLNSYNAREIIIKDSKGNNFIKEEELDKDKNILNVLNGTLDLSENQPRFMEHSPGMLLSKVANVEYHPDATCHQWEKFLDEIMQGDIDKIKYLQKICGISLTGDTKEECCWILYGSTSRNGKSTFCLVILSMLGDYAISMQPESLAKKKSKDGRQASGDIARLAGARFVNCAEPDKKMIFDEALLKQMLGRDKITARHLQQREFEFVPEFKLVINTNHLPIVTDNSLFTSDRLQVVTFDRHFKPEERDMSLKDKLQSKEELAGILNWCIEGLRLYRTEGLEPPQCVKDATNDYRSDSDKIGNFIAERLRKSEKSSTVKTVYAEFCQWCDDCGYGTESKGNFIAELKTRNLFRKHGKVNGVTYYNVVKGYEIAEKDFQYCDEKTPFAS